MEIRDHAIIITGASSGIGEATALALGQRGGKVALAARRADRLRDLQHRVREAGGEAINVEIDVTDRGQVERLVSRTKEELGGVDALVNNAGLMPLSLMKNRHIDEWEQMVDVNIKGVLFGIGAVLPTMLEQKSGHIVNVSSVAGRRVVPGGTVYSGTKFAVSAISEGLRAELSANQNIRVTCIEPGVVRTELTDHITDPKFREGAEAMKQMRQLGADDVANAIVYALEQPSHVDVSEIMVMPTEQR